MANLLITGASGFIGSHLAKYAHTQGSEVHGTYLTNYFVRVPGCNYYRIEIQKESQVRALVTRLKPSIVIHIAGTKDIDFCSKYPEQAYQIHAQGTLNVVQACQGICSRLVYISTDCVFDGTKALFSEDDFTNPFNRYGEVKYEAERISMESDLNTIVLRTSLLFGWVMPKQSSNTVMDVLYKLTNQIPVKMPAILYNTPLYVGDAVEAIYEVALSDLTGIFHLAGADRISRYDLAIRTANEFGLDQSLISPTQNITGLRPTNSCLSTSKLEKAIGKSFSGVVEGLQAMRLQVNALSTDCLTKEIEHEVGAFSRRL